MSSTSRTLARLGATVGAAGLLTLSTVGLAGPASAHVTVTPTTTAAGSYAVLTFSVGHGCDGSPTTSIAIQVPEGINSVTPTRNDYYDVEKKNVKLDPPVSDGHGGEYTERTSEIVYTAKTALPDGYRDSFEVQLQIPADAEGKTLVFPTVQTCQQGETRWIETAAAGQSEDDLESPAPAFEVTAASGDGHGGGATDEESEEEGAGAAPVAAESGDAPATTNDSAGSTDDSGNGLAVAGLATGVIGILVAAVALARTRRTA